MEEPRRIDGRVHAWTRGAPAPDPPPGTVGAVMSFPLVTVDVNVSLDAALARMQEAGIHHLLLTDREAIVALVSDRNLVRALGLGQAQREIDQRYRRHPVFQIAQYRLVTIAERARVEDAAALLYEQGFSALPVVNDDDRMVGIVTSRDLLRYLANLGDAAVEGDPDATDNAGGLDAAGEVELRRAS
ncbi:MAG: CBS domain-containing protein [Dehalococcoidia bacterium]